MIVFIYIGEQITPGAKDFMFYEYHRKEATVAGRILRHRFDDTCIFHSIEHLKDVWIKADRFYTKTTFTVEDLLKIIPKEYK